MSDREIHPTFETAVIFTGHLGFPGGQWKRVAYVTGLFCYSGGPESALASVLHLAETEPGSVEWDLTELNVNEVKSPAPDKYMQAEHRMHEVQTYSMLRVGGQRFGLTPFATDALGRFPPDPNSVPDDNLE